MTITLSTALRMPRASVAAPAPLALGPAAEPCAPKPAAHRGLEESGITTPAFGSRLGGSHHGDRFGGIVRPIIGGGWDWQDQAQLAGGGPLRE